MADPDAQAATRIERRLEGLAGDRARPPEAGLLPRLANDLGEPQRAVLARPAADDRHGRPGP
jgi:hypothetical protein